MIDLPPTSPAFLVYCTADAFNRLQGSYAARVTRCGLIAAPKVEHAARFRNRPSAEGIATRLARKFHGTAWATVAIVDLEVRGQ